MYSTVWCSSIYYKSSTSEYRDRLMANVGAGAEGRLNATQMVAMQFLCHSALQIFSSNDPSTHGSPMSMSIGTAAVLSSNSCVLFLEMRIAAETKCTVVNCSVSCL